MSQYCPSMDPLAEKYYSISPYAYAVNNPINYIDPDGQDYWSTNDPTLIAQFLQTLRSRNYSIKSVASFDMSGWQHATDAQFTGNLTYNDKTKTFYSSYGTVENGETTIHGVSVKASSTSDNGQSANIESPWLTQASGKANNVYPEFAILAAGTKPGLAFIKWIWNALNSPVVSTTNTFNANAGRSIVTGNNNFKKINDSYLKAQGLDAHTIKREFLGNAQIAHYDLYTNTQTREILILQKGGVGILIPTGYFVK